MSRESLFNCHNLAEAGTELQVLALKRRDASLDLLSALSGTGQGCSRPGSVFPFLLGSVTVNVVGFFYEPTLRYAARPRR